MESISASSPLSVVIIGRNEGGRLTDAIKSVRSMRFPVRETLYVDCGSTDASVQEAEKAGVKVIEIAPEQPSAGIARNAGWRAASTPLVLFLDGDSTIDPDFAERAMAEMQDPKVGVVWGQVHEKDPNRSIYHRILSVHWPTYHLPHTGPASMSLGTALTRRSLLEAVGGHDPGSVTGPQVPTTGSRLP